MRIKLKFCVSCSLTIALLRAISDGPRFVRDPESQPADIGDSVTLTCDILGNPSPAIYWRRQGNERILATQSSLLIKRVSEIDFTAFTCSASSPGYETVSRSVYVLRKGPPTILSSEDQSARYGETGTIECLVKSIPPPVEITWTRNGQPIDFGGLPRFGFCAGYRLFVTHWGYVFTLFRPHADGLFCLIYIKVIPINLTLIFGCRLALT